MQTMAQCLRFVDVMLFAKENIVFSERYAVACPPVVCLSVTFVRPTQAVQIFGNISTALGNLAIR